MSLFGFLETYSCESNTLVTLNIIFNFNDLTVVITGPSELYLTNETKPPLDRKFETVAFKIKVY